MNIVYMGSPQFAAVVLATLAEHHNIVLVVTQPDKRSGRGRKIGPGPVKLEAMNRGIEVFQPRSARTGELTQRLSDSKAELAVVVAYGKILPTEVLGALPLGCINVHASILPELRGAAPIQWAVIDGQSVTGVSIMQLDEGMDTGPVFASREVTISPNETSGELFERLAPVGAALLVEVLADLESGTATALAQQNELATHARMLTKRDGLINWSASAVSIHNLIRGVDPWPGAQTRIVVSTSKSSTESPNKELVLKLFGSRIVSAAEAEPHRGARPGQLVELSSSAVLIACGEGVIAISEIQPAGSRRMPAPECARGRRFAPGDLFLSPEIEPESGQKTQS